MHGYIGQCLYVSICVRLCIGVCMFRLFKLVYQDCVSVCMFNVCACVYVSVYVLVSVYQW